MREILFKAKRVDNGEWVEGDYHSICKNPHIHAKTEIQNIEMVCCVIPETVCQYTGLQDKNGKKIFEGDIIKWVNFKGEIKQSPVKYDLEWNRFCVWINGAESYGVNKHLSNNIEIIENIHDRSGNSESDN